MKKSKRKTLIIFTIISIFLCGCLGTYLLFKGADSLGKSVRDIIDFGEINNNGFSGLLGAGVFLCGGGISLLIPLILLTLTLVNRKKKGELEDLKTTGASEGDPIPPTA